MWAKTRKPEFAPDGTADAWEISRHVKWAVDLPLVLAAVPVLVGALHLGALALLAFRMPPMPRAKTLYRFAIVVPAHDEEGGIQETVQSLLRLSYPKQLFRVVVVADNCSDRTAERARRAGAEVLLRDDPDRRGKGFALSYAFERLAKDVDAVVVIDADSTASPNLLEAFASRLERGAHAIQARNRGKNPQASWRTRLMTLAFATFHRVRSLARERLGVSAGLHGNGMALSRHALETVPHRAHSLVEDLEYAIQLGLAGFRVHYADEAEVFGDMAVTEHAARSQRQRWEVGRKQIARTYRTRLLTRGLAQKSGLLLDQALDLLVPPLSTLALSAALGLAFATAAVVELGRSPWLAAPWLVACALITAYVLRGAMLSGRGGRALLDLAWAPLYVLWRVTIRLAGLGRPRGEWVRTERREQDA
jgi:1,2-diacylglycerol 3-beta-glucosyltransferase